MIPRRVSLGPPFAPPSVGLALDMADICFIVVARLTSRAAAFLAPTLPVDFILDGSKCFADFSIKRTTIDMGRHARHKGVADIFARRFCFPEVQIPNRGGSEPRQPGGLRVAAILVTPDVPPIKEHPDCKGPLTESLAGFSWHLHRHHGAECRA